MEKYKRINDLENKIILATAQIADSICHIRNMDISNINNTNENKKYSVYVIFNDKNISYLADLDEDNEFNLSMDLDNRYIKFISSDGKHSFSFLIKEQGDNNFDGFDQQE